MSPQRTALVAALAALALTGCAGDGGEPDAAAPPSQSPQATEDDGVSGVDPTSEASAPAEGACSALPYDDDGDYSAGEAGTARVVLEGEALVVEEVEPASGWEHEVTTEEDDEVEIAFTSEDGATSTLHVETDDEGLAEVEVCAGS